jgi:predicted DNA-binding ribbon-helix-helix protein
MAKTPPGEPTVTVLMRRRGRPRTVCVDERDGSRVSTYVPASFHDRLVTIAKREEKSVAALVRSWLMLRMT